MSSNKRSSESSPTSAPPSSTPSPASARLTDEHAIRAIIAEGSIKLGASAASIFLLSADGRDLHGALVGWDWTRSSFVAQLAQWPNVARAIEQDAPILLTADGAKLAEEAWFEHRGIKASIVAPMSAADGRGVIGVTFFDDADVGSDLGDRLVIAKEIADRCAALVR